MSSGIILFAIWLAFGGTLLWIMLTAREGHETDEGFRFGPPELPDAGRDGNDFKSIHDAGAESADALRFAPVSPFHEPLTSAGEAHDHA